MENKTTNLLPEAEFQHIQEIKFNEKYLVQKKGNGDGEERYSLFEIFHPPNGSPQQNVFIAEFARFKDLILILGNS